ncbi:MAG: coenzyme PQQ synthesis protein B [Saprospiraceae bacterium]|nr:MAG: coenzyme PQQ synthesis protein B [Saprospiraceae bacterium]
MAIFYTSCQSPAEQETAATTLPNQPYLIVLGIAQDAGYPQAGCNKDCCQNLWDHPDQGKMVSCLALVDPLSQKTWLFDATPDFREQLHLVEEHGPLSGIFLTHAHIGHYTGLMQLGREVMGAAKMPVFAMPRMREFLANNGPWSQLVKFENIQLSNLRADSTIQLNERLRVTPFLVPHRDEFSETVGYLIESQETSVAFIPDIDKWDRWKIDINALVRSVDYAFLDGTFFQNGEIPGRDMAEIPHPFIIESMNTLKDLDIMEKAKVHFIHFNHSNPVLQDEAARKTVKKAGFRLAEEGQIIAL